MSEHFSATPTGAHPTVKDFVERLREWGFTERRIDGVHLVLRGPHGGTLRVIRSLLGRADADLVAKAAALAGVDVQQFWAGPKQADEAGASARVRPLAAGRRSERDGITARVLAVHIAASRPLGFDQVVELCQGQVTRSQVRHASASLCRDGDLARIRSGVYQWSGGARDVLRAPLPGQRQLALSELTQPPATPVQTPGTGTGHVSRSTTELFEQLFPTGVHMTADLLADFERWADLTDRLAARTDAS